METTQLVIYGAGGFAREVAWLAEACSGSHEFGRIEVVSFVDDNVSLQGTSVNEIPVRSLAAAQTEFPLARMVCGIGIPRIRELVMKRAADTGFSFASLVDPGTRKSRWVTWGEGSVICAGNILTTNIDLGRHVQINLDCTVGHDVSIGDCSTLAPGVHVSGWVKMGRRVYVGTGATIINGTQDKPLEIGDDAVIGAGACVTRPVAPSTTVVGIPAKPRAV